MDYRMNAGHIPRDHWVHGAEGGGRNLGEACHIYDLFTFLADAEATGVSAHAIVPRSHHVGRNDNFVATMSFADGSVASLTYTALGHAAFPKETAELFVDGKVAVLDDYRRLRVVGAPGGPLRTPVQDKGHKDELVAFADAVNGKGWASPWWQQLQAARIALAVEAQIDPAQAGG
jgi:predicted dehydrogenase